MNSAEFTLTGALEFLCRCRVAVMQRVNILIGQVNAANVPSIPSIHYGQQYAQAQANFAFISNGWLDDLSFCVLKL